MFGYITYSTLNGSVISALGHSNSPTATNSKRSFKKVMNFLSVDKTAAGGDGIFAFISTDKKFITFLKLRLEFVAVGEF